MISNQSNPKIKLNYGKLDAKNKFKKWPIKIIIKLCADYVECSIPERKCKNF